MLVDLAAAGAGGVVDAPTRRTALAAYARLPGGPRYDGLTWSTGRMRVPAEPPLQRGKRPASEDDVPALAVDNAGGIVHLGSTFLDAPRDAGDPRVTLAALADARRADPQRVDAVHLRVVRPDADRFTALATAFQNCGAYVDVAAGTILDAPLQLLWIARPGAPAAVFAHTVIRIGAGARASVVERHLGANEAFVASIVEVELEAGAHLDYVVVQQADERTRAFVHRRARCAAHATIAWHDAELGGSRSRSIVGAQLAGRASVCEANAVFFARGYARSDGGVEIEHSVGNTQSRTTVRRAATDRARGRFTPSLRFAPGAERCVATLRDDGLILGRNAALDALPLIAVPAQHASVAQSTAIGSLDDEELFYVQTRGISRSLAERMMALAFFEPAIARFPSDALRDEVRTALDARLDEVPDTFA